MILYGQVQVHWLLGIEAAAHLASALLLAGSGEPGGVPAGPPERPPVRAIDWQVSGVAVFGSACFVTNCLVSTLLPLARLNNEFGTLVNLGTLYAISCFTYDPSRRWLARFRTMQGRWLLAGSLAATALLLGAVLLNRFPGNRMTHWLWGLSILVFLLTGFTSGGAWRWIAEQSAQDPSGRPPGRVRALQAFLSTGMLLGTAVIPGPVQSPRSRPAAGRGRPGAGTGWRRGRSACPVSLRRPRWTPSGLRAGRRPGGSSCPGS